MPSVNTVINKTSPGMKREKGDDRTLVFTKALRLKRRREREKGKRRKERKIKEGRLGRKNDAFWKKALEELAQHNLQWTAEIPNMLLKESFRFLGNAFEDSNDSYLEDTKR